MPSGSVKATQGPLHASCGFRLRPSQLPSSALPTARLCHEGTSPCEFPDRTPAGCGWVLSTTGACRAWAQATRTPFFSATVSGRGQWPQMASSAKGRPRCPLFSFPFLCLSQPWGSWQAPTLYLMCFSSGWGWCCDVGELCLVPLVPCRSQCQAAVPACPEPGQWSPAHWSRPCVGPWPCLWWGRTGHSIERRMVGSQGQVRAWASLWRGHQRWDLGQGQESALSLAH